MEVLSLSVRKGAWIEEEDVLLNKCIQKYGEGKWHLVPSRAGLNRCRKSCRLRWFNYLKPDIKRGVFDADEIDLIVRLHNLLGNRWSLIAGRIPGRTANDVKNYCNTHFLKKKLDASNKHLDPKSSYINPLKPNTKLIKPRPRILSKNTNFLASNDTKNAVVIRSSDNLVSDDDDNNNNNHYFLPNENDEMMWWENYLMNDENQDNCVNNIDPSVTGESSTKIVEENNYGTLDELFLDVEIWNVFNP